jgi:hypothetical protein
VATHPRNLPAGKTTSHQYLGDFVVMFGIEPSFSKLPFIIRLTPAFVKPADINVIAITATIVFLFITASSVYPLEKFSRWPQLVKINSTVVTAARAV